MINGINIYSIITTVLMVVFGFLCSYIRTKVELVNQAGVFINEAEEEYINVTKAGNLKFEYVLNALYDNVVPTPLKMFISKQMVSDIIQKVFDQAESYATKQLDKVVDKIVH